MITAEEALEKILGSVPSIGREIVALSHCSGRVLAEDLLARADNPPFDNSGRDGYALRAKGTVGASREKPSLLQLSGEVPAGPGRISASPRASLRTSGASGSSGSAPRAGAPSVPSLWLGAGPAHEVAPGQAVRILTGAPIPRGADAVVMQEDVDISEGTVRIFSEIKPGEHVRSSGGDIHKGDPLLPRGRVLGPLEAGLLASQGIVEIPVARRPKAAIITTGNEIVSPADTLLFGRVRDSNGPSLAAAMQKAGGEALDCGIVGDRPDNLRRAFSLALEAADILLVSGGVSVGDYDYTTKILEELGMKTCFWKMAIKPGKPLLFGMRASTPVFGLPGNPVSAWVCFEEFVRPAIYKMLGRPPQARWYLRGRAENEYEPEGRRQQYVFCQARREDGSGEDSGGHFILHIIRPQRSDMIAMASQANAIALAPLGVYKIRPGDKLAFRWIE